MDEKSKEILKILNLINNIDERNKVKEYFIDMLLLIEGLEYEIERLKEIIDYNH